MKGDGIDRIAAAIDAAEDFSDPLDGLAARTATNAGAAFAPEMLERLDRTQES